MEFKMPEAKRERLEELLEYLGERADDFRKCFDVESAWCWKYADLALRGIERRDLGYAEGHHIVPRSFYGKSGRKVDDCNLTVLNYGEHLWAHYCLVKCATGKMRGKMSRAFITMYNIGVSGSRPLMPSEAELLEAIPKMELRRIQAMEPKWAKVEAEGRTHIYEDPKQHHMDYYEANKEKISERHKAWREANKEKIAERRKAYYEANRDKIAELNNTYREANREKLAKMNKAYYDANREKIAEHRKAYREANREKLAEHRKAYREANREKISSYKKAYREANREKILEQGKNHYETMKAAGYRYRTDHVTGKRGWVFVGLPEAKEVA